MDYNNIDVVMIGSDQQIPDEKKPALPIKVVTKDERKNHFRIKILHPNKNKDGINEVLYDKVHRISLTEELMEKVNPLEVEYEKLESEISELKAKVELKDWEKNTLTKLRNKLFELSNSITMEYFVLAQTKATDIINTKFANLETKHEEILHISAGRTGKMKLNKRFGKKKDESSEEKKDSGKQTSQTRVSVTKKKVTKKKVVKKKVVKKKVAKKKVAKKKVAKKKVAKKRVAKKKVAKKKIQRKTSKKQTTTRKKSSKRSKRNVKK
jgi:hypothetical protein